MLTKARGLTGLVLAFAALTLASNAHAQEAQSRTYRGDEIVVIDATRGLALDEKQTIRVQVRNDLAPAGSVVVSVVSLTRPEYVLGAVLSNEAREFLIDTRRYVGGFQLVARGAANGRTQISRQIDVHGQALVKWNLSIGLVRVKRFKAEDGT